MRILAFLILFLIFVAVTAPLEKLITPYLSSLAAAGVDVRIGSARLALPAGLRVSDVRASSEDFDFDVGLDSVYVGINRSFDIDACGGTVRGRLQGDRLEMSMRGFDPSRCLRIGQVTLESPIDGTVELQGLSVFDLRLRPDSRASIDLRSAGGIFGGHLPFIGPQGPTLVPVGDWEFGDVVMRGRFEGGRLLVEEGHALTSGVQWELTGATLKPADGDTEELRIDFRARMVEESPRANMLMGLLPKATADADGWRRYRLVTTAGGPKLIGLQ
ncbi:MAG TPA: type II secretion system protein GspN [Candidatus Limnocylindrales bacterium]|nr:type II secretion system protein GspN [Candidatus Limnocylindrales bacterium]